jgi:hypothetical protein
VNELTVSDVLRQAAGDIEYHGWYPGGSSGDERRCIWTGVHKVIQAYRTTNPLDYLGFLLQDVENVLMKVTNTTNVEHLFQLNDSQRPEEGKQWAVTTLLEAAKHADAHSVVEGTDTDFPWTRVCGPTTNAENPLKRFLKKLKLVK